MRDLFRSVGHEMDAVAQAASVESREPTEREVRRPTGRRLVPVCANSQGQPAQSCVS
jgi:hypothetical protein